MVLIDLAVAIHVTDRFAIHNADTPRYLNIQLPLRHQELFGQSIISDKLREILYWYTGDQWNFIFTSRQKRGRSTERQECLQLDKTSCAKEVALWSGGLDSLVGLVNRIHDDSAEDYLLFGSGCNSQLHFRQRDLAKRLSIYHSQHIACTQVIYRYNAVNIRRNRDQRSRGFVFMLLGAVCALLAGQNQLYIYENGVGAINLPFRASEVGLDHTRAVHPISLILMGELISQITNTNFTFINPSIFQTKADMCRILRKVNYHQIVIQTVSCDRLHRNVPNQCGSCSSCILRKQSLFAAGVPDETKYLWPPSNHKKYSHHPSIGNHLRAMLWQVQTLRQLLSTDTPWDSLVRHYPQMMDIIDRMDMFEPIWLQNELVQMYQRYVNEWEDVQPYLGQGLLGEDELRDAA